MTATILQFPLHRRLSPQLARLVDVAAARAEGMGYPCDRADLAHLIQRFEADAAKPEMQSLLSKARAAIAALPPRRPQP